MHLCYVKQVASMEELAVDMEVAAAAADIPQHSKSNYIIISEIIKVV